MAAATVTIDSGDTPERQRGVAADEFRDVIGHFASGVTVITTLHDGRPYGTTANAIASLSLEPPMLVLCMNRESATGQAIGTARAFAVNILAERQTELARCFARKVDDKFDGVATVAGSRGQPLLEGAIAHVECRVVQEVHAGTHSVFLACVDQVASADGAPLAYFRGQFYGLEPTTLGAKPLLAVSRSGSNRPA
jgi:flavin reductase (DIM6/NTAB) family NADH-FMN oxidoreductase RutF